MAEQYDSGVGSITIKQELDARGIPGPKGGKWNEGTIMRILGDRRITGIGAKAFRHKAKRYKTHHDTVAVPDGTYPQIISVELFNRIDRRMKLNKLSASRASKHPEDFLLRAGFVRCSVCGWGMGAKTDTRYGTFIYRCRKHGSIVSQPLDAAIWAQIVVLSDHVTLMEEAIELAKQDNKLQHEMASIQVSIDHWQKSADNFLKDLQDPELTGDGRTVIRRQTNDALVMVKKLEGEKMQLQVGMVDKEREEGAYQEILDWCREVKEARGELSYQRKRDFIAMLGVVVTIIYDKEKGNQGRPTYDMRVRLPALQELITLPGASELCDANTVE